jgi:hypothetical protein
MEVGGIISALDIFLKPNAGRLCVMASSMTANALRVIKKPHHHTPTI